MAHQLIPKAVLEAFGLLGHEMSCRPIAVGLINQSFCIDRGGSPAYVLQEINKGVFPEPDTVQENIRRVLEHVATHKRPMGEPFVRLVKTKTGEWFYRDDQGRYWRVFDFVRQSRSLQNLENRSQAREAGRIVGEFHRLLRSLAGPPLQVTLPGFHDTVSYQKDLLDWAQKDPCQRRGEVKEELAQVQSEGHFLHQLSEVIAKGRWPIGIWHGDTKVSNILFHDQDDRALCLIDLDTVMPGRWFYDFGDLVRSACIEVAEEEADLNRVQFRGDYYQAIKEGYLSEAAGFLSKGEQGDLAWSCQLVTYELAIRFLADYLAGDRYFATRKEGENLQRFRVQWRLLQEMKAAFHHEAN